MIYGDSGCDGYPSVSSDKRSITGRDRLTWRKDGVRLLLFHRSDQNPLAIIEPDAKYFRLYRIRYPDGHLSAIWSTSPARKTRRARSRFDH
jgi:hypothetical protein